MRALDSEHLTRHRHPKRQRSSQGVGTEADKFSQESRRYRCRTMALGGKSRPVLKPVSASRPTVACPKPRRRTVVLRKLLRRLSIGLPEKPKYPCGCRVPVSFVLVSHGLPLRSYLYPMRSGFTFTTESLHTRKHTDTQTHT